MLALHITATDTMVTIATLLVGVLTPAVVAIINHPVWTSQTKRVIAVVCAAVLGILTVIANGVFTDWEATAGNTITVILAVIGASQTAYSLIWKPSGASDAIESSINSGTPSKPAESPTGPTLPGAGV